MEYERPNPDLLLAKVQAEEAQSRRGSLRIFFGYAAGVGKTYSMLKAARESIKQGREVIIGYVEPHERPETRALIEGIETIPLREISHRGVSLREFDVDATLARHPQLVLVDELAHTNAPGSRHEKRWQDIEELLRSGIHVWTTLNVQHIESLNDVIGQITGIRVRETIPDSVFDSADELELIDITPEELLTRLNAGKIYLPEQAQRALTKFFQKGNLTALRELSLRQAARRVHTDVESARRVRESVQPWATNERLMVCLGEWASTARAIRTCKRMAMALDAPWLAVSVDLTGAQPGSRTRQQMAQHFRLAEQLGAETMTLPGQSVSETLLEYARSRNVTKILIGNPKQTWWGKWISGSIVDEILAKSIGMDLFVIHGEGVETRPIQNQPKQSASIKKLPYFYSLLSVCFASLLENCLRFFHLADSEANTVMLFLAAVAWVAFRYGRGPSILTTLLSVLVFDFFYVPPYLTFAVSDFQYLVTFAVMMAIGLAISTLTSRLRAQVESTRLRESRTYALFELGKQLSSQSGKLILATSAGDKIREMFNADVAIYLSENSGNPELSFGQESWIAKNPNSLPVAQWVLEHDQIAGAGTNTLPNAGALFLPLMGSRRTHGVIAVRVTDFERLLDPDTRRLLESCANQLSVALERDQLAMDVAKARIEAEAAPFRSKPLEQRI